MGGNVVLGDEAASRIDLKKFDRSEIVPILYDSFKVINKAFQHDTGLVLWSDELVTSKKFLSGSAFHFFATNEHSDAEFLAVKKTVGDLDTKIPEALSPFVKKWLDEHKGETYGDLTLIGYKDSVGQYITLWKSKSLDQNIQIDLEQLPFIDGVPTTWAEFSHSSEWVDLAQSLKGVAHKYLLRALNAKDLKQVLIRMKSGKEKVVTSAETAFSITGMRQKLEPVMDGAKHEHKDGLPVYRELTTAQTGFNTDLDEIFITYFGHAPNESEQKQMWSFTGLLALCHSHFNKTQQMAVADGFANTLWGPGAQSLYRGDPDKDLEEKDVMMDVMAKSFGFPTQRWDALKRTFYK
jgi:hypothetical protein